MLRSRFAVALFMCNFIKVYLFYIMKNSTFLSLVFSFMIATATYSQTQQAEIIPTEKGDLTIQPILHATMVWEWNELIIYADPYGGKEAFEGAKPPSLILITDIHGDHMNTETLEALSLFETPIITCQAVADLLPSTFTNVTVLNNGAKTLWNDIEIEAIPMYNLPESEDAKHTKGRGNGYVITLGGKRIYISGDTEDIPEMRALQNIDVAFVCMNLPYTMEVTAAASAVLDFKPKTVYPFHYRGAGSKFSDVSKFKALVNEGDKSIDVRLLEWYPKKE